MKTLENHFFYLKSKFLAPLNSDEIINLASYELQQKFKLIFQTTLSSDDFHSPILFTLWKLNSDRYSSIYVKVEAPKTYNGFDHFEFDEKKSRCYKLESFINFVHFLDELELKRPKMSLPLLVAAFEGEGGEILMDIEFNKKDKYFKTGGSSFEALGIETDFKDRNYEKKITKKQAEVEIKNHLKLALQIAEPHREQHIWSLDPIGHALTSEISDYIREMGKKKAV